MFLTFFYSCQYLVLMKLRCCHINVTSLPSLNPWMTGHSSHRHFFCRLSSVPAYGTVTIAASAFPPLFFESNPIFYLFSILLHSQLFVLFSRQSLFFFPRVSSRIPAVFGLSSLLYGTVSKAFWKLRLSMLHALPFSNMSVSCSKVYKRTSEVR